MVCDERLGRLIDKHEIGELRSRYSFRVDNEDWDGFRELLTEDAVGVYASGTMEGREEVVEYTRENGVYEFSMHLGLMPVIELDGDTGSGEWYMAHYYERLDGTRGWHFGRYVDEYRRVDGEWKFSYLQVDVEDTYEHEPNALSTEE